MRLETRRPLSDATRREIAELVTSADATLRADGTAGHDAAALASARLRAALDVVAAHGGDGIGVWASEPTPAHDALADEVGLTFGREILQMRRPLPADEPPADFETRAFRVGEDEEAWLEVNNRAFAGHHEQSAWDLESLRLRMAEPWFDPDGFLLHERDGRLAGFCWAKIHRGIEPPIGEIYVIAVDPDFVGHGLGRALTLAGLRWLYRAGVGTGMLYVDSTNDAALNLYRRLGFRVDHIDRGYYAEVPAAPNAAP
jgi:mycothiol synthase